MRKAKKSVNKDKSSLKHENTPLKKLNTTIKILSKTLTSYTAPFISKEKTHVNNTTPNNVVNKALNQLKQPHKVVQDHLYYNKNVNSKLQKGKLQLKVLLVFVSLLILIGSLGIVGYLGYYKFNDVRSYFIHKILSYKILTEKTFKDAASRSENYRTFTNQYSHDFNSEREVHQSNHLPIKKYNYNLPKNSNKKFSLKFSEPTYKKSYLKKSKLDKKNTKHINKKYSSNGKKKLYNKATLTKKKPLYKNKSIKKYTTLNKSPQTIYHSKNKNYYKKATTNKHFKGINGNLKRTKI